MNVTVIAVGDIHARVSNIKEIELLGLHLGILIDKAKAEGGKVKVVLLGDLSDTFEKIHITALKAIVKFLTYLSTFGVEIVYVVGNHDAVNNRIFLEDDHAFVGINIPNVKIVDKVEMDDTNLVYCPYVPPGRFAEALETLGRPIKEARAIFCHQEFRGAKMGAIESKIGDTWAKDMPLVVSGHIHDYDRLAPNVLYVGVPFDHSFGESGDKTVSMFRFTEKGVTEERIDLGMPKKRTYTLPISKVVEWTLPENTYARINLVGTLEEHASFKKTKEYNNLLKIAKVVPKYTDRVVLAAPSKERRSFMEILKKAVEEETSANVKSVFDELAVL